MFIDKTYTLPIRIASLAKLISIFALFFILPVFAQTQDSEILFQRKVEAMQAECDRIKLAVPCAIGMADVDKLPAAISKAERDAIAKLALSVQAFISYHASDSSYIGGRNSKELSSTTSKIKTDMLLSNSQTIKQDYVKLADSEGEFYRAIVLRALGRDKSLYEETEKKVDIETVSTLQALSKTDLKQIASKTVTFLLGIAKKAVGLPL